MQWQSKQPLRSYQIGKTDCSNLSLEEFCEVCGTFVLLATAGYIQANMVTKILHQLKRFSTMIFQENRQSLFSKKIKSEWRLKTKYYNITTSKTQWNIVKYFTPATAARFLQTFTNSFHWNILEVFGLYRTKLCELCSNCNNTLSVYVNISRYLPAVQPASRRDPHSPTP